MSVISELDKIKVDWSDYIKASEYTRALLHDICNDKAAMTELVDHMLDRKSLRGMCEKHQLLDLLILYDALEDRGFRVRLHMATEDHLQRIHDHRYSFSTYILCGEYEHILYDNKQCPYMITGEEEAKQWQDKHNVDMNAKLTSDNFDFRFKKRMMTGNCLTLHHSQAHTVLTTKGTSSLVIRGPSEKERSFIYDKDENSLWWRFGKHNETPVRRAQKIMTDDDIDRSINHLKKINVL